MTPTPDEALKTMEALAWIGRIGEERRGSPMVNTVEIELSKPELDAVISALAGDQRNSDVIGPLLVDLTKMRMVAFHAGKEVVSIRRVSPETKEGS